MSRTTKNSCDFMNSGIVISPTTPVAGEEVKIIYDGLLAKSGATHIYAHVGYGNKWENVADHKMVKTPTGYETTVPVLSSDSLNVCFKDCANNWDNNSGKNYSFDITQ